MDEFTTERPINNEVEKSAKDAEKMLKRRELYEQHLERVIEDMKKTHEEEKEKLKESKAGEMITIDRELTYKVIDLMHEMVNNGREKHETT